jgi:glycerol-3-phosphate cytidylyltransferase/D-beta-D-heptose 7-phosphate kinase/D-beta-D-heptose 1-phosphate adenosyltransferase
MFEAARERTGYLIVIVNNDQQQILKKGRVIQADTIRARIVAALRAVDAVYIAVDEGPGIERTFDVIRADYPRTDLEFCNGGDRKDMDSLPKDEVAAARRNSITLVYGIGGVEKADSSTRILAALDEQNTPVGTSPAV